MTPPPGAREVFELFCLAWLALALVGLVLVFIVSWWRERKKPCDHGYVLDFRCLRCHKPFPE